MKERVWIVLVMLLTNLVSASHSIFVKDSLKEGEAKAYETDDGIYVIELVVVSGQSVKFRINNKLLNTLREGDGDALADKSELIVKNVFNSEGYDEVEFYFYGSGDKPLNVELQKGWDIDDCNFDGECINETKEECCYDCGCLNGYKCEKNNCIKKAGCTTNEECNDDNPCTTDSCENFNCRYERKDGCELNNECLVYSTIKVIDGASKYCSEDGWKTQKKKGEECSHDYECLSGSCKDEKCYVRSFSWFFTAIVLIIILSSIFYAGKKVNFIKKIKKRLFWKF